MEHKSFQSEVKVSTEGIGEAIFSTLNVVDRDGDVTAPGAFGEQLAKISPAHDWSAPGMGLAKISERGNEAVAALTFNNEMQSAKEWAASLKFNAANGISQEWSYGFDVLEESFETRESAGRVRILKRLKVYEVSPVMVGAGINTRTSRMKSSRTLEQHCADVMRENRDFAERLAGLKARRAEDGRSLSQTNCDRLKKLLDELEGIKTAAGELIEVPDDEAAIATALLRLEIERGQLIRMGA